MFTDATRAISLLAEAMTGATLAVDRMRERAATGWVSATELADTLARGHGVPFGTAHAIVVALVREARPDEALSERLARATRAALGREIRIDDAALAVLLSPEHFVAVRRGPGEPAPEATTVALAQSTSNLEADRDAISHARARLAEAAQELTTAVSSL
jgi:argininosuccinate lyase